MCKLQSTNLNFFFFFFLKTHIPKCKLFTLSTPFFKREFQPMTSTSDDSFLSSNQDVSISFWYMQRLNSRSLIPPLNDLRYALKNH